MSLNSEHETTGPLRLLTCNHPLEWWKDYITQCLLAAQSNQPPNPDFILMLSSFRTLIAILEEEQNFARNAQWWKDKYIEALESRYWQLREILEEDDMMPTSYLRRQEITLRLARKYRMN